MKRTLALIGLLFSLEAAAQNSTFMVGDWQVSKAIEGMQIAKTVNESNSVTGIVCFNQTQKCAAYIGIDVDCDVDGIYPMMINAATGSAAISTTCTLIGDTKYYIADEFNRVKTGFESGGEIGFAMPLASGKFRVVRFSTRGATAAIKSAMTLPEAPKRTPTRGKRDETL